MRFYVCNIALAIKFNAYWLDYKYQQVLSPKYQRKVIYDKLRKPIR